MRWFVLCTALGLGVVALDLALSPDVTLIGLLGVPPLVAAIHYGPRPTAGMALACAAVAVALAAASGEEGFSEDLVRVLTVAVVGGLAVAVSSLRIGRERAAAEAGVSTKLHTAMVESALDCVISIDHEGHVLEWNPASQQAFRYSRDEAIGRDVADLIVPPGLRERHRKGLRKQVETGHSTIMDRPVRLEAMRKDGTLFPIELSITRVAGTDPPMFLGSVRDVTERKRSEESLAYQATHDTLTGLANRALLMDRVDLALRRMKRQGTSTAVLFADLDGFKEVNDSFGHAAGDELLMGVAERFRGVVRPEDTLARVSGDEFAVVCEGLLDPRRAAHIAERLLNVLQRPIVTASGELTVRASVGVAVARPSGETPETLLSAADAAMYRAKRVGGDRCIVFDERMRRRARRRIEIESELRTALDTGELDVFYQPQVDLMSGEVVGVEALARWRHPRRGLLPPAEFIRIAEETGVIGLVDDLVLRKACIDGARWAAERGLLISVNLSLFRLSSEDLASSVERALEESGMDPSKLCLEITEENLGNGARPALAALWRLGVHVAVDDFGTGHSSLAHLSRRPVDQLKIDRTLIEGLVDREDDRALVVAAVNMGHALHLTVVAEGVETARQVSELRDLGCDVAQGFRFARPRPAAELERLLAEGRFEVGAEAREPAGEPHPARVP